MARTIRALHELAERLSREGIPREEILRQLMARGLNEQAASKILAYCEDAGTAPPISTGTQAPPRRRYGTPDMNDDGDTDTLEAIRARLGKEEARADILYGMIILGIGIVITAATYSLAKGTGGVYVVAWGAVLFGIGKIGRGLMNL